MEEATKLRSKDAREEEQTECDGESHSLEEYDKTITNEQDTTKSRVVEEDNLQEDNVEHSIETNNSFPEEEKCGKQKKFQLTIDKFECGKCNYVC